MRNTADNLAPRVRQAMHESTWRGMARDYVRNMRDWTWDRKLKAVVYLGLVIPFAFLLPWFVCYGVARGMGIDELLGLLAIMATICAGGFATALGTALYRSPILGVKGCLPVADAELARQIWRDLAGWSAVGIWYAGWASVTAAVVGQWPATGFVLALLVAVGQWALCIALGTFLAVRAPRFPWFATFLVGGAFAIAGYVIGVNVSDSMRHMAIVAIHALCPAGWLSALMTFAYGQGLLTVWLVAAPLAVVVVLGILACRDLIATYRIRELNIRRAGTTAVTSLTGGSHQPLEASLWGFLSGKVDELSLDEVDLVGEKQAGARIRSREFLSTRPAVQLSFAARGERRWLSPRESAVFDFLTNDSQNWSAVWVGTAWAVAIALVCDLLCDWIHFSEHPVPAWFLHAAVVGAVVGVWVVCWFQMASGPWLGMNGEGNGAMTVPRFALVPVSYDEISRTMYKVALARVLMLSPMLAAAGWLAARFTMRVNPSYAMAQLAIIGGIIVALTVLGFLSQGHLIAWQFYRATRFKRFLGPNRRWTLALLAGSPAFSVPAGYSVVQLSLVLLASFSRGASATPAMWVAWGTVWVVAGIVWSWATWLIVRAAYQRGFIDLFATKRENMSFVATNVSEQSDAKARRKRVLRQRYGWLWRLRKRQPAR